MDDSVFDALLFFSGSIIILIVLIILIRKKKANKDFFISMVIVSAAFLGFLYGSYLSILEIVDSRDKNIATATGSCEIVLIEEVGGRYGTSNYINVNMQHLTLTGDMDDFQNVKEGKYKCTVKYTKHNKTLLNLKIISK